MNKLETTFLDKNKPSMNEILFWFQVNFPKLADDMNDCKHAYVTEEPNPYHIENSVWAHTMMVCQRAEIASEEKYSKINLICALLHDLGKPLAREVIDFQAKKPVHSESNEIRNNGKNDGKPSGLNRTEPPSGKKVHQRGHEGLSFYKAIPVVNQLEAEGILTPEEKIQVLTIISMHGTLFDNIGADGEMKKPYKVFEKFVSEDKTKMVQLKVDLSDYTQSKKVILDMFRDEIELYNNFIQQVKNDSLGRFFTSKDGRKNNAVRLGKEIFTEDNFIDYIIETSRKNIDKNALILNTPRIRVTIGCPGSGKSTWLEDNSDLFVVVSRDEAVIEFGKLNNISGNYSEVWKALTPEQQKEVDAMVQKRFKDAVKIKANIVIDMTNMSRKSRRKWLMNVPKEYSKEAIVFATGYDEVWDRLEKREKATGKAIPGFAVMNMMKSFMVPDASEVNNTTWVF